MQRNLAFITNVAHKAADAIRSLGTTYEIKSKIGRGNIVTDADLLSEKIIMQEVRKHFPDDMFLSEETSNNIDNPFEVPHLWVVDPIDGTNNFAHRRNYSAISIGLVEKGEITAGVVYNFFTEDIYTAERGNGSTWNGNKLAIPKKNDITDISVGTDNSSLIEVTKRHLTMLLSIQPTPWCTMRGAAALEISEVAAGKIDVFFHTHLHPWDSTAAMLVVREAGGVVRNVETGKNATFMDEGVIAGHQPVVEKVMEYFHKD